MNNCKCNHIVKKNKQFVTFVKQDYGLWIIGHLIIRKNKSLNILDTHVTVKNLWFSPSKACQPGTYVLNFQDICGYCLNFFDNCYRVNGISHLVANQPAYKGDICKTCKLSFFQMHRLISSDVRYFL